VADLHLELYDLEYTGGVVRVTVDQPGGVGMDAIASLTRALSRAFDEQDPIDGHFTLEVSSPGLERPLRTPDHFAGAVGETVTCKTRDENGHASRLRGVLAAAGTDAITITTDSGDHTVALDAVDAARTVFEWGPAPKPGKGSRPGRKKEPAA
jgi:ribosome maturation factor RimP